MDVLNRVQPGTGVWVIEHPTFLKWVNGDIDTLWCPGILRRSMIVLYVIIDALDEFGESEEDYVPFLSALRSIGPQVKVLCTSRFLTTFENHFHLAEKLEILAQSEDIKRYLESRISGHPRLSKHVRADPKLMEEIVTAIIEESQGMFLLAELQLTSLSTKINRKEVRLSLRCLPTTLDATYSEALRRIYSQGAEAADLMNYTLFSIIVASRSLTVLELQRMYATQYFDSQTVRPVHYTAQSYFERSHPEKLVKTREALKLASLAYLNLDIFSTGVCTTDADMHRRLEEYPFLVYAAMYWGSDVDNPETTDIVGTDGETALIRAAASGQAENVRVLLDLGAMLAAHDHMSKTALQRAAKNGLNDIVQHLLDRGVDANLKTHSEWTPLMSAVLSGNTKVVEVPVQAGALLHAETSWGDSALSIATRNGQEGIAYYLADKVAILPQNPAGRRASVTASRRGFGQLVRRLTADYDAVAGKPLQRQGSRTLNKGKKSKVFICANRVSRVTYAVNIFDLKLLNVNKTDTRLGDLRQKFALLRKMQKHSHSNLIGLIDVFAEYSLGKVCVVLERGEKDLFQHIVERTNLSSGETRNIYSQLFSALDHLHNQGWIHRDIKLENILLTDVAPEILAPDSVRRYDYAVEVWSAGVVLYNCLCGFPPLSEELNTPENPYTLAQQIKMGRFDYPSPYWDPVEDAALNLIDRMITVDPKGRFMIPECVKHPWMNELYRVGPI
ncbi:kinase-like domain-containing protein [Aspergillus venezuelensis]